MCGPSCHIGMTEYGRSMCRFRLDVSRIKFECLVKLNVFVDFHTVCLRSVEGLNFAPHCALEK